MAQTAASKLYLNFGGGLVTETNPMVFPENTCKDLDNVDLQRQGYLQRRLGLDFEPGGAYSYDSWTEAQISTYGISKHEWRSVNGKGDLNFLVIQVGGILYFHNLGVELISQAPIGKIDISSIRTSDDYYLYPIDATYGKGHLFIVGRKISPAYITYNEEAGTFTGTKITVKIRDINGLDENTESAELFGDTEITVDNSAYTSQLDQDIANAVTLVDLGFFPVNVGNPF